MVFFGCVALLAPSLSGRGRRRPCGRRGFDGVRGEWTGGGEAVDDAGRHDFRRFLGSSQHYLLLLSLHDLGKLLQMPCSFAPGGRATIKFVLFI